MAKDTFFSQDALSDRFIRLMESKRGLQAKLSKSINKQSSYFSEIKRGKPVNALHLRAVGVVCGAKAVAKLLAIDTFENGERKDQVVDESLLAQVIDGVESKLKADGLELASNRKARLIALLYQHFSETEQEVSANRIGSYLRLVA